MLREAKNNVVIEGILSEVDLELGSFVKNRGTSQEHTVNSIRGTIKIKVDQTINNEVFPLEIPVHVFAAETKNNGDSNPAYESIKKIKDEFISIAAAGNEDEADRIRITSGRINMNEYWQTPSSLSSYPRINASFFTKVKKAEYAPKATFDVEFVIGNKVEEVNSQGEPTGRLKIMGIMPKYNGSVDVVPFYTSNPKTIDIISQYWNQGDTVKAVGKLYFTSTVEKFTRDVDFGEPIEDSRTISVSDLIITGGSQTPLEGDFAYNNDDIQKALLDRKANLEAKKELDLNKVSKKKAPSSDSVKSGMMDLGF